MDMNKNIGGTAAPSVAEGWQIVPIEPNEDMVVDGFESAPDPVFSSQEDWDKYDAMSGCQQSAHRARLCYAAMLAAAPPYPVAASPAEARTTAAADVAGLSDREIMEQWEKNRLQGEKEDLPFLRVIVDFARHLLARPAAVMARVHGDPDVPYTYASAQATGCAGCGAYKHTPLRIDAMGGYVCLTCIDNKLGSMLGEFGHPEPDDTSAPVPASEAASVDVAEGAEILDQLIDSIQKHGNYSADATVTFLHQIKQCLAAPAAPTDAKADATDAGGLSGLPYGWINAGTERQQTEYATLHVGSENPWMDSANAFPVYTTPRPAAAMAGGQDAQSVRDALDTDRIDYIERKGVRGGTYQSVSGVEVILYVHELKAGGFRHAIDCMIEREKSRALIQSPQPGAQK